MNEGRFGVILCSGLLVLFLTTCRLAEGQGSYADYQRAASLAVWTEGTVLNESIEPRWLDEGARLWYRRNGAKGRFEYVMVDCPSGKKSPLFDPAVLARAIEEATGSTIEPDQLPVALVSAEDDQVFVLLASGTEAFAFDRESARARVVPPREVGGFRLEAESRVRRSRRGRSRTSVLFSNGLDETLSLFWIDESGRRRAYGAIEPGAAKRQGTYAGHAWVLVDGAGLDRGCFVATTETRVAWVDAQTAQPEPPRGERQRQDEPEDGIFVREYDVWHRDPEHGREVALTTDGTEGDGYGGRRWMSPDGSKAVVMRTVAGDERKVHYVEAAPEGQLQPELHSYDYLKPGDRLSISKPHLFDLESKSEIPIDDTLFGNPWSITDVRWSKDSSRFTFLFNQRGHQVLRIVAIDAKSGKATAIIDEHSDTFIDYSQKQVVQYLDDTEEIIWSSERDGWHHLYLYDARTGRLKNRITGGAWVVRGIDRVDEEQRQVWFRAGGIDPDQDPYHVHYCRVDLDGSDLVMLTEGDGNHTVSYAPDGRFFVDRFSRVDLPPITELRRTTDGALICELERADWTALLAIGWRPPRRFVAKGRDGATDIWGIIRYPTNHDREKSYPIIEAIYAGPHGAHVPRSFQRNSSHAELAELGFIVVQIDGMGTNFRSKAFHDVCWKNLGDAGFLDRIAWIRAAAEEDSLMDLTRVGIHGGSAGGQNALRALLAHGDFYHAAAADCGCHDNRMDKIWWNEAWMGWPIGRHYEEQSNVTQAHRLEGKLLLTVGAMDENVDPSSTMQVVDALIHADKDFELIVFPSAGHGAAGSPYGQRRIRDFFVRHLLGVKPRWGKPAQEQK